MITTFWVTAIEQEEDKRLPIAAFPHTGLLEIGATFDVLAYQIFPAIDGEERIHLPHYKTKVEIVGIEKGDDLTEVIIKPIGEGTFKF